MCITNNKVENFVRALTDRVTEAYQSYMQKKTEY